MREIDYYVEWTLANITRRDVALWLVVAAAVGLVCLSLNQAGRMKRAPSITLPILAAYLLFILTITLFARYPTVSARYELSIFWSYRAIRSGVKDLILENVLNVVVFVPVGVLLAVLLPREKIWLAALLGLLFSAGIELTQLLAHLGLFEFDDIVHNTLGVTIGAFFYLLATRTRST